MSERTEAIRDTLAGGPHDPAAAQAEARVHREEQIIAELEEPCRGCPGCSTGDCANVVDKAAARIAELEAKLAEHVSLVNWLRAESEHALIGWNAKAGDAWVGESLRRIQRKAQEAAT